MDPTIDELFSDLMNTEEADEEPAAELADASSDKTSAEAAEVEEAEAEFEEAEDAKDQMAEIKEQLDSIHKRLSSLAQSQPKPPEDVSKVRELPTQSFVSDGDIADMLTDANRLNEILNKVYKKAYEDASNDAIQTARVEVPRIVSQEAQRRVEAGQLVKEFWSKHAYLFSGVQGAAAKERRKQAVQLEVNRIYAQDPSLTTEEILNRAAKSVADLLGIAQPKKGKAQRTQFAQAGSRSAAVRARAKAAPPSKGAEVADILKRVGR